MAAARFVLRELSFEIGHLPEKTEALDNTPDHVLEVRALILAQKVRQLAKIFSDTTSS